MVFTQIKTKKQLWRYVIFALAIALLFVILTACTAPQIIIPEPEPVTSTTPVTTEPPETTKPTTTPEPEQPETPQPLTEEDLQMKAIADAYLEILFANEYEIRQLGTGYVGVLFKDLIGDGVPELAFIQADFSEEENYFYSYDTEPYELVPYSEEQPYPGGWYLDIWTYDTEPKLLLRKRVVHYPDWSGYRVFAGADGRITLYIKQAEIYMSNNPDETHMMRSNNIYETYVMINGVLEGNSQVFSVVSEINNDSREPEHMQFYIDGVEVSESNYHKALSDAYEKRGETLLFTDSQWPGTDFFGMRVSGDEDPPLSTGFNAAVAMLENINLDEKERANLVAHVAYNAFMASGIQLSGQWSGARSHRAGSYYLLDMNNDGTDELIVTVRDSVNDFWYWRIYTCQDGVVRLLDENNNNHNAETYVSIVDNRYINVYAGRATSSGFGVYNEYTGYDGSSVFKYTEYSHTDFLDSGAQGETSVIYWLNDQEISEDEYIRFKSSLSGDSILLNDAVSVMPRS